MQEFLIQDNKLVYVKIVSSKKHQNIVINRYSKDFFNQITLFKENINRIKNENIKPTIKTNKHNKILTLELLFNLEETIKITIININVNARENNKVILDTLSRLPINIDQHMLNLAKASDDITILTQENTNEVTEEYDIFI